MEKNRKIESRYFYLREFLRQRHLSLKTQKKIINQKLNQRYIGNQNLMQIQKKCIFDLRFHPKVTKNGSWAIWLLSIRNEIIKIQIWYIKLKFLFYFTFLACLLFLKLFWHLRNLNNSLYWGLVLFYLFIWKINTRAKCPLKYSSNKISNRFKNDIERLQCTKEMQLFDL